jgi:sugar lactone lactonase YvrE
VTIGSDLQGSLNSFVVCGVVIKGDTSMFCRCVTVLGLMCLMLSNAIAAVLGENLYVSLDSAYGTSRIGWFDDDGAITIVASRLDFPQGVALDSSSNLYFADYIHTAIRKISPSGAVTTFANVKNPVGLAFDSAGNLYSSHHGAGINPYNNTISKITPDGTIHTYATGFKTPSGIAFDTSGNLYVANRDIGTISKVTPSGFVSTFATGLSQPNGLAFDNIGNLFVSNWIGTIDRITPSGNKSTFVASGLACPFGIAFDQNYDYLYVANYNGASISRVSPTGVVSTFASGLDGSPSFLAFGTVPEPSTLVLLGVGAIVLLGYAWRRRQAV